VEKIAQYQKRAAECREQARRASAEQRTLLSNMARTWEGLAKERKERLTREMTQIIVKPTSRR